MPTADYPVPLVTFRPAEELRKAIDLIVVPPVAARRERAMAKFRSAKWFQKFASINASVHNPFNQERHLYNRENFKPNRSAALAEWRQLAA